MSIYVKENDDRKKRNADLLERRSRRNEKRGKEDKELESSNDDEKMIHTRSVHVIPLLRPSILNI